MVTPASKYADVRRAGARTPARPASRRAPTILIPKPHQALNWGEWMWSELREGGMLQRMFAQEKHTCARRWQEASRRLQAYCAKQNAQSDYELKAMVPLRDFIRWHNTDPDFWKDDKNLKRLKRDNDMAAGAIVNV
jgi:hypothetical protein